MKIMILSDEFPPFSGGAGIYSNDLTMGLVEKGLDVVAVVRSYTGKDEYTHIQENFKMYKYTDKGMFRKSRYIYTILKQEKPDILHTTTAGAHISAAIFNFFHGINTVVTVHGSEVYDFFPKKQNISFRKKFKKYLMKIFFKNAKRIICVSHSTKQLLEDYISGCKATVVYNGVRFDKFIKAPEERVNRLKREYNIDGFVLGSVSRLDIDKGNDVVLKALPKVIAHYPNVKYIIVGEGEAESQLRQLCVKNGLTENVIFTGNIKQESLGLYYSLIDCFILPSRRGRRESFGLIYVEASYFKKVVIGTTHGGVPEVILNEITGYTADPNDSDRISEIILEVISNPEKSASLAEAGYNRVVKEFSLDKMIKDTLEVYNGVLNDLK